MAATSTLIIFQRAKLSTWSVTHLCWCNLSQKFTTLVLFLHENSPLTGHLYTQNKLAYLGFQYLDHPPYSPNLAPSDYHLFPGLKIQLQGRHFSSKTEVIAAAETWLNGQNSEFF